MKKYLPCESDLLWLLFIQQRERIRTWKTEDLATANNEEKSLHPLWVVDVLPLPSLTQGSLSPTKYGWGFRILHRLPSLNHEKWHSKVNPISQSCSGSWFLLKLEGLLETTTLHKWVQCAKSVPLPQRCTYLSIIFQYRKGIRSAFMRYMESLSLLWSKGKVSRGWEL